MKQITLLLILTLAFSALGKQHRKSSSLYYKGTEKLQGEQLKKKLHAIIKGHKAYSYKEVKRILKDVDQDLKNPKKVNLIYSSWTKDRDAFGGEMNKWNREHVWAKSRGNFGTKKGAGTDLHHLRAADASVNQRRGHLDFDEGGKIYNDKGFFDNIEQ